MDIFPKALMCIFLILVIPYVIAYLYGYARAYKLQAAADAKPQGTLVVSIHDNNGKIRLSLRIMDILYAVSEDNYVKIFYEQDGVVKNCMIRTTAKNIEDDLEGYITRCHRSYLINIAKVRFFNNDRDNLYVILDQDGINPIPVSRSYRDAIASLLSK
jgi:DNA-binding LytR/AlgR family response regulator